MNKRLLTTSISVILISTFLVCCIDITSAIPPGTPEEPRGPPQGSHHVTYNFSILPVYAQDNHDVYYWFDWGDSTNTGWFGPFPAGQGSIVADHQWTTTGVFQITAKAKDAVTSEESPWSPNHDMTVVNVETPGEITGPDTADIDELRLFTVVSVSAPYNHQVLYLFDWGDNLTTGWFGPFPSGMNENNPIEASHHWGELGTYQVRVKAKDNTTGDESDWSPIHSIKVGSLGPLFVIAEVRGGFGVSVSIQNKLAPSKYVDYIIDIAGGQISGFHIHRYYNGTVFVKSGETVTINTPKFFSLGRIKISVVARCAGEPVAAETYDAFALLWYVWNVQERTD